MYSKVVSVIIICAVADYSAIIAEKVFAVSPFNGLQDLYLDLKHLKPTQQHSLKENVDNKDVCEAVIGSAMFFDAYNVHPVHEEGYCEFDNSSKKISLDFTNQYKLRKIAINGRIFQEFVFLCLACNRKTENVEEFFISREYKLNELPKKMSSRISTKKCFRFVFEPSREEKPLVPAAIAEKPAQVLNYDHFATAKHRVGKLFYGGAICKMSAAAKIRLCTIILMADAYRKPQMRFAAFKENKEPLCEKRFLTWRLDLRADPWALTCVVVFGADEKNETYYISQGFKPNHFIIFQNEKILAQTYV